jgi:oligopeptide/dipeptide ABC transporter ATP-binding protein
MLMYLGKVVEGGPSEDVYLKPRHPYSNALLSAIPLPDPRTMIERKKIVLVGDVPSPINPPNACRFHPRCPKAQPRCAEEEPLLAPRLGDPPLHVAACHFPVAEGENLADARPTLGADQRIVEPEPVGGELVAGLTLPTEGKAK